MNTRTDSNSSIENQLQRLLPKSLDDVITKNRDKAQLRIATEADINALRCGVPIGELSAVVSRWCLIALELPANDGRWVLIYLTGYNKTHHLSWMTSPVVSIDKEAGLLLTHSGSLYRLEGENSDEPDLPYICATLNRWGIGEFLGIPPFFF